MLMLTRSGRTTVLKFECDGLRFGERLNYRSLIHPMLKTECVFIRHENGRAVIMFAHAERVARVNYEQLERFTKV